MNSVGVMHLIDTLDAGGAERVAVNLANGLASAHLASHLCTTRRDGALSPLVQPDVGRICLHRRQTVDRQAVRSLVAYIRQHNIQLLHAHETSILIASVASLFSPFPKVIWHDHFGRFESERRSVWLYRLLTARASGVVAVNDALARWSRDKLKVDYNRVWYVPNFSNIPSINETFPALPGNPGQRIVCVANLRPQKDHGNLLAAMAQVIQQWPEAHLLLIGGGSDAAYRCKIERMVADLRLGQNVTLLGERQDVGALVRGCDIGVLSSLSEGLPLSLLEYGLAGLATVCTSVGQCPEVLDRGRAGILVPPGNSTLLADALVQLLADSVKRQELGRRFQHHVEGTYSARSAFARILEIYDIVLSGAVRSARRAA